MKIAISGASGKTGFRIAEEALKAGYKIRLITREGSVIPSSLSKCERYAINSFSTSALNYALKGCDTLFIATGARPSIDLTGPLKVDAIGVRQQVQSCKNIGIKRVILVSSLCAGKIIHPLNLFGLILLWKRLGEKYLQNSNIDWTIVRPGGLNEKEENLNTERVYYSQENTQQEGSIPRRLVAKVCLEALKTKNSISKIIEITSSDKHPNTSMNKAIESFSI